MDHDLSWHRDEPGHNWAIYSRGEFVKMAGMYEFDLIKEIERLRAALNLARNLSECSPAIRALANDALRAADEPAVEDLMPPDTFRGLKPKY